MIAEIMLVNGSILTFRGEVAKRLHHFFTQEEGVKIKAPLAWVCDHYTAVNFSHVTHVIFKEDAE